MSERDYAMAHFCVWMMTHSAWEQLHEHMTIHGSLDDMVAYVQEQYRTFG